MFTLRSYASPIEAGMAKSMLEAHGISCSLADENANEIAQHLTDKNPTYYYGYSYLGYIALERNHLKEAEGYFARAYELFPTSDNEQKLQAVRKRLEIEHAR